MAQKVGGAGPPGLQGAAGHVSLSVSDHHLIWSNWISNLEFAFQAANIQNGKRKNALLLYIGAGELRMIHQTFSKKYNSYKDT